MLRHRRLELTDQLRPRPVFARLLRQRSGAAMEPPTDAEKHDAIRLLAEPWPDDVGDEAFRILDEYGR